MIDKPFLKMVQILRQHEEIVLYGYVLDISEKEEEEVNIFLKKEYEREVLNFPHVPPGFDATAALWAAKAIYVIAQLILYRKNKEAELQLLLPDFESSKNPAAIISADLCLRFLPDILSQLKMIDPEDPLISILETRLTDWHYSGINYPMETQALDFNVISSDSCLFQLYINRTISFRNTQLAQHEACISQVKASIGIFNTDLWSEIK
jgi:hypothetical protein